MNQSAATHTQERGPCLALFDLDHTLIPLDSDYEWTNYFISQSPPDLRDALAAKNQQLMDDYNAGTLDPNDSLSFLIGLLTRQPYDVLHKWRAQFFNEMIVPNLLGAARGVVEKHRALGDTLAIVTATNRFVVSPIAMAFGIEHLLATEPEIAPDGSFTGRWVGEPCFRAGKITHVQQWLQTQGKALADYSQVFFYSDSINDVPLLERVTDPVATNPSPALESIARERGWKIIKLFA
ncbi:MAG: HAD family hydrolase [Burkholderiaceae bacterium]